MTAAPKYTGAAREIAVATAAVNMARRGFPLEAAVSDALVVAEQACHPPIARRDALLIAAEALRSGDAC
jgi:hypothetical protein